MSHAEDRITDVLKLGAPAERALANAGISTFEELSGWTRKDLAGLHGIGPKALSLLDPALSERALAYRAP